MKTLFTAILSIALSVAAQFSLKAGMSGDGVKEVLAQPLALRTILIILMDKYILGGLVLYGLSAVVWLGVLARWDVSKAYPLVGLGFAFTIVVGYVLGEHVPLTRVIGVTLICSGVILVGRS